MSSVLTLVSVRVSGRKPTSGGQKIYIYILIYLKINFPLLILMTFWLFVYSYGRVYTADPYHAALTPAAYGVGAMVGARIP